MFGDIDIKHRIPLSDSPFNVVLHDISLTPSAHVQVNETATYQPAVVGLQLVGDWMREAHDLGSAYG